ncbi:serine hydrolase domain-containing protein [Thioalkalivibrio sulfidiphilus]|uniref:serine hydrolase domain-containing protein n=1 Tax=Thioalkalivibrio sulfidiphilus TaxID=1033854 RepID=UPI00039CA682|nr:serine hydrolase domain-containing protein [Thioalkalivibrio sulfidiphilus]
MSRRWYLLMLCLLLVPGLAWSDTDRLDLDERLRALERALEIERVAEGYPSLSIGIVHRGAPVYLKSLGYADQEAGIPASPDTLYRIGSLTKVITASLMVSLRDRGYLSLDDPVSGYLPGIIHLPSDPRGARQITFRHLATHTSGLPRNPDNLPRHDNNPFEGYDRARFYAGVNQTLLISPTGRWYNYSNAGYGLIGIALEQAGGASYETLLRRHLLEPLGMHDTLMNALDVHPQRVAVGYSLRDGRVREREWDMGAMEAAGGLYSTVEDLARFLALHMRAGSHGILPVASGSLTEMQMPQRVLDTWDQAVGIGWHVRPMGPVGDVVWHTGALGGYSSYMGFSPRHDVGVIVLTNRFRSVEHYGNWLLRRSVELYGEPTRVARQPALSPASPAEYRLAISGG